MNILFLSLLDFDSLKERNIYTDLLRECIGNHHEVYVISPMEKRRQKKTVLYTKDSCRILKVRIGNIQKTGIIEKGISMMTLEKRFKNGIKKYFSKVKFDLVMYTTPPITFEQVVKFVKRRDNAQTYLILRDIFPQNAVDMGMMSKYGLLYLFFRVKEKRLYQISDFIGCLSQANVDFIQMNHPEVERVKLEIYPNSIGVQPNNQIAHNQQLKFKRNFYGIPEDKIVYIYGGNLGKPQGVDFIISCLRANQNNEQVYFLIIGSGTEYAKLDQYVKTDQPGNVKILPSLPKEEYEELVTCCDVGLVFLNYRFLIPNFPSRILSYMQAGLPVLAATDISTDIGKTIMDGGFGEWCPSNDVSAFSKKMESFYDSEKRNNMGKRAYEYLEKHYSVKENYHIIMKHFVKIENE